MPKRAIPSIYTGADNAGPAFLANLIKPRGQLRLPELGIKQFLARRYHADAQAGHWLNLRECVFELGHGGVKDDVRPGAIDQLLRSEEHTSELQSLRHLVCR